MLPPQMSPLTPPPARCGAPTRGEWRLRTFCDGERARALRLNVIVLGIAFACATAHRLREFCFADLAIAVKVVAIKGGIDIRLLHIALCVDCVEVDPLSVFNGSAGIMIDRMNCKQ